MLRTLLSLLAALALSLGAGFAGPGLMAEEPAAAPAAAAAPAEAPPAPPTLESLAAKLAEVEAAAKIGVAPGIDHGNTAWLLTATVLVLLMTIPGLALFYGGLVRQKNVLSVLMQCFAITCLISILWLAYGYSAAFSLTGMVKGEVTFNSFIGALDKAFLAGVTKEGLSMNGVPESIFIVFQLTFAIITPALIIGAFAERMKFSAMMIFTALWFTIVYLPICHMVWAGDGALLWDWGVLDFAGGTVVHINAGVAGLVCALMLGKRKGYPERAMKPHNLAFSVIGASLLWCGWFGFNAGSAVASIGDASIMAKDAGMAMLVTMLATAGAGFAWMVAEWMIHGKPSVLGIISGAVAGLVAITPASGTAGPVGALVLGLIAGVVCFIAVAYIKKALGYDDSLDAFGVHGVGGLIGAILTGLFAAPALGGFGTVGTEGANSIGTQLWVQTKGALFTIVYTGVLTAVILLVVKALVGLRVSETEEEEGLDVTQHGEEAYGQSN
jgi:Amt family ammonium transporter